MTGETELTGLDRVTRVIGMTGVTRVTMMHFGQDDLGAVGGEWEDKWIKSFFILSMMVITIIIMIIMM